MNYSSFSYNVNDHTGIMTIYADDKVVAELSLCSGLTEDELNDLADEVLFENGYTDENCFTNHLAL